MLARHTSVYSFGPDPLRGVRTSEGSPLPTDYTFTGQKFDSYIKLLQMGARWYDPDLGRFTQPDSIVPNLYNPQSLNRFSYARNNPVNRVDPTGHDDCRPDDDWCWQNRWYQAHGYHWSDRKQDWVKGGDIIFQDEKIRDEVLQEAGVDLEDSPSPDGPSWTGAGKDAIARGIALLARSLSGGMQELRELLGGNIVVLLLSHGPVECLGNPCTPPPFVGGSNGRTIYMPEDFLTSNLSNIHQTIVHELAHAMDWNSWFKRPDSKSLSDLWNGVALTPYAQNPYLGGIQPFQRWESFAEAVAVNVFGFGYQMGNGPVFNLPDFADQLKRLEAILNGWTP
jgi:RHS repeat-associated protein